MSVNRLLFSWPLLLLVLALSQIICPCYGYHEAVTRYRNRLLSQEEIDTNLGNTLAFLQECLTSGFTSDNQKSFHKFLSENKADRARDKRPRKISLAHAQFLLAHPLLFDTILRKEVVTGADYYVKELNGDKVTLGQAVCSHKTVDFDLLNTMLSCMPVNLEDTAQIEVLNQWNAELLLKVKHDSKLIHPASSILAGFLQRGCPVQNPNLLIYIFMHAEKLSHNLWVTLFNHGDFDASKEVLGRKLICGAVRRANTMVFFGLLSKVDSIGECADTIENKYFSGTPLEYAVKLVSTNVPTAEQKATLQNVIIPYLRNIA